MPNEAATGHSPLPEALSQQSTHPSLCVSSRHPSSMCSALWTRLNFTFQLPFLPSQTQKQQPALSRPPKSTQRLLGKQGCGVDKMQGHREHLVFQSVKPPRVFHSHLLPETILEGQVTLLHIITAQKNIMQLCSLIYPGREGTAFMVVHGMCFKPKPRWR